MSGQYTDLGVNAAPDPKCSCLFEGEYMAPRRSRLQRATWTAGTTYKEKNKSKNKSKNAAKGKTSSVRGQSCLRGRG